MAFRHPAFAIVPLLVAALAHADELTPMKDPLRAAGFEPIGGSHDVAVFQDKRAHVVRVAAEGRIDAPPERVKRALLAYEEQKGFVKRVQSEVVERTEDRLYVYQRLDFPITSDRDFTLLVRWGADAGLLWITFDAVTDRGPAKKKGVVRITSYSGSWQLMPVDGGKATLARFQTGMDIAGHLPLFLARSGTVKDLPNLFESIRAMVAAGR